MVNTNIKRDLHYRLGMIFGLDAIPDPLGYRGSVQPTIDYFKAMQDVSTLEIPATAGNVDVIISPGTGKKLEMQYGTMQFVADATVISRTVPQYIYTPDKGSELYFGAEHTTGIAASETKSLYYTKFGLPGEYAEKYAGHANLAYAGGGEIWENDEYIIDIYNGQAGDSISGRHKIIE